MIVVSIAGAPMTAVAMPSPTVSVVPAGQGLQGPPGPPGASGGDIAADPLAYYILAKS